jgi:cyclohexyl-isocyanide hydratase
MLVGIPVYEDVNVLDVTGPYEMFSWTDIDVELVAEEAGPVKFRGGLTVEVSKAFKDVGNYDVLWVPGGEPNALARLMGDPKRTYLDFLIEQSAGAQFVTSVCEGALLLAAAGLLDGYEATTHWAFIPCLTERFPNVKVVPGHPRFHRDRDRNRVTGGGVSAGLDEALELIVLLRGTAAAQRAQQGTQYYPDPPVTSEIPQATTCPIPPVTIAPRRAG